MNRYVVFIFSHYHPNGGMDDFASAFDTQEKAENHVIGYPSTDDCGFQILDTTNWYVVKSGDMSGLVKEHLKEKA